LQGPDITYTWQILGANGGTLDSLISFSAIQNLTGGAAADTFALHTGGNISGSSATECFYCVPRSDRS
jgi:hypothetical protein